MVLVASVDGFLNGLVHAGPVKAFLNSGVRIKDIHVAGDWRVVEFAKNVVEQVVRDDGEQRRRFRTKVSAIEDALIEDVELRFMGYTITRKVVNTLKQAWITKFFLVSTQEVGNRKV